MNKHETTQLQPVHPFGGRYPVLAIALGLAVLGAFAMPATAIELKANGDPVVNGSGANMTARWSDAGEVNGESIDVFAEIIAHTGNDSYVIVTEDDDFKFQFTNGVQGEQRSATLRWSFYEAGTNTPVSVPSLAFTIDDLDDDVRHESLSTEDAYDYTVNEPTDVAHGMINGTVSASGAGGVEYDSGDPEAAVKLLFANKSTLVITYNTEFDGVDRSAFHHDGDGDFVFDDPPVQLYYTFNLNNNGQNSWPVSFFNSLPAGLLWDPDYAEVTGNITGEGLVFNNGNRNVSAGNMVLHPGANSLKLRTLETSATGTIVNEATVDPLHPQLDPITRSATITLP